MNGGLKILNIKTDDKVYLVMYSESLYKVVFGERKILAIRVPTLSTQTELFETALCMWIFSV